MHKFFVSIFMMFFLIWAKNTAIAQEFGGNPASTKWKQLNTDTARIIFPKGLDTVAQKVAALISEVSFKDQLSLGNKLQKINIILQNQPVITNGYVAMGPFKSEFYTTPSADNYDPSSLSWPTQLAVHEYRHVQQYNNFDRGISAVMKRLFGQEGYALAVNAAIPNWFFEGDAVYSESILAPQGRGTTPFFLKAFPALWQYNKKYSWMKIRNGSLKDYIPNHYDLGYLLVNYGSQQYGHDFWRNVTQQASAYKGLFYPMQKAIKQYSGLPYKAFIKNAFDYYKQQYKLTYPETPSDSFNVFKTNTHTVTNYVYPYQISETALLYQKSSNNKRSGFYIKNEKGEKLLRLRDISIEDQYGYRNGKIVYAAYESHPRWGWQSYSVIKILDINNGRQQTLTKRSRYFSPDISPNGNTIVANSVALNGKSTLTFLNAHNGTLLKSIAEDGVNYFSNTKFLNDSVVITILRNNNGTTAIALIDMPSGKIKNLTPPSFTLIGGIDVNEDKIYFTASQNLKDELFYFDMLNGRLHKLSTPGVGSYFLSNRFNKLNWSIFTADGYQLQQTQAKNAGWKPATINELVKTPTGIISDSLHVSNQFLNLPIKNYTAKPYPKLTRPFNFHSWRPNYTAPEYSFTIYGNNILNTTETQLYYIFNETNRTHTVGSAIIYGGLYPFIRLGSDFTFNRNIVIDNQLKQWNEWNNYLGLNIPLNWASGLSYKAFNIESNYYYRIDFNNGATRNNFDPIRFSYLAHGIGWAQQAASTRQDIYPRWGYSINTRFRHALNLYKSWQSYTGATLYLPGIVRTHSLVLNGFLQYSGSQQQIFGNQAAFARGYIGFTAAKVYTARANYHFPIVYPDWGFANIFYLQRVRANTFYDYTQTVNNNMRSKNILQSVGAEIFFDTKWWNQHPISFGFRTGTLLNPIPTQQQKLFFEFVLPTNLIPR